MTRYIFSNTNELTDSNNILFVQSASDLVRESNGLEPLVAIIKEKNYRENKPLIAAATGKI